MHDVPINKLIRTSETHERSVTPIGAVLVTADGYVRHHDLGVETRVHRDSRPLSLEESIGLETREFRVNVEANTRLVRELAERAQDLSLSLLEA